MKELINYFRAKSKFHLLFVLVWLLTFTSPISLSEDSQRELIKVKCDLVYTDTNGDVHQLQGSVFPLYENCGVQCNDELGCSEVCSDAFKPRTEITDATFNFYAAPPDNQFAIDQRTEAQLNRYTGEFKYTKVSSSRKYGRLTQSFNGACKPVTSEERLF